MPAQEKGPFPKLKAAEHSGTHMGRAPPLLQGNPLQAHSQSGGVEVGRTKCADPREGQTRQKHDLGSA